MNMSPEDFQKEVDKQQADSQAADANQSNKQSLNDARDAVVGAVVASTKANMKHRENTTTKVDVQNDIAETDDINRAILAINNLAVMMASQPQKASINMIDGTDLGDRFNELGKQLTNILTAIREDTNNDNRLKSVTDKLDNFIKQLKSLQVAPDPDVKTALANIETALKGLNVTPKVNVPAPKVTVQGTEVDLSPLETLLKDIRDTVAKLPKESTDNQNVVEGLDKVYDAIANLSFPVPNYVLPFKDSAGKAVQIQLDASGNLPITGGSGGGGGTQYTNQSAQTAGSAIGTLTLGYDGANVRAIKTSNTGVVSVDGSATTQPVSGTVSVTGVATATNQTGGGQKTQIVDGSGNVIASTNNTMNINATAQPAGGYTPNKLISAATTNATSVKASAGTLGFLSITNTGSAPAFVKFYNKASAPTVGTDTPLLTFMVPANATAANGAGNNPFIPSEGLAFGTGIAFAITGAAADTDTTAVAASQVIVNYGTA